MVYHFHHVAVAASTYNTFLLVLLVLSLSAIAKFVLSLGMHVFVLGYCD